MSNSNSFFSSVSSRGLPSGVSFAGGLFFENIGHEVSGKPQILSGITLSVEPSEVMCLLGPSGSGKTTLLRIAAGIERQTSGRVFLNEREISGPRAFIPPEQRSIGLVFQDFALFPHLTILENVRFGLTALSREQACRQGMIALSKVGLENHAHAYPHVLSGGEQQRVALARALAPRPAIVLMDEPFSGLDSRLKDSIRTETLDILRRSCATAMIVTHDAEEAMRMGNRIALVREGFLVQVGCPEDFYLRPVDLFTAGFFSELNLFHGIVKNGFVETPLGKMSAGNAQEGMLLTVAVRTTGFQLDEEHGDISARVLARHYLGVSELFDLVVEGYENPVRARIRCGDIPAQLRDIRLTVRRCDVLLFEEAKKTFLC